MGEVSTKTFPGSAGGAYLELGLPFVQPKSSGRKGERAQALPRAQPVSTRATAGQCGLQRLYGCLGRGGIANPGSSRPGAPSWTDSREQPESSSLPRAAGATKGRFFLLSLFK